MCCTAGMLRVKPAWHRAFHQCCVPSAFPGRALWLLQEPTATECGVLIPSGRAALLPPLLLGKKGRAWPAPLLILMWSQPPTALWLPGDLQDWEWDPNHSLCGKSPHSPPPQVAAGHPRLSQALGSLGTVPGPPGLCGGSWLALCLLLPHHRLAGLHVAKALAFWLCRPPPLL